MASPADTGPEVENRVLPVGMARDAALRTACRRLGAARPAPLSDRCGTIGLVRVAVVPGPGQSGLLCELGDDGSRRERPVVANDLVAVISMYESNGAVRWVWPAAALVYPALLRSGVRVARCHDVALAASLLAGRDGPRDGATAAGKAWARLKDAQEQFRAPAGAIAPQQALFEPAHAGAQAPADPHETLDALIQVHADQVGRIAADELAAKFAMLVTAESAGALVAAEMSQAGLPWRADVHDELLTEMLGPRPPGTGLAARAGSAQQFQRPARLAELAAQISAALGARRPVNPDSPAQVLRALAADGVRLPSTRLAVLRDVDHPAIQPLLEYKELSRLHSAFGWNRLC